jgi:hypothetical protein
MKKFRIREEAAISLAFTHGRVTRKMLIEAIPMHRSSAHSVLKRLVDRKFFLVNGVGVNTYYTINKAVLCL